MNSTATLILGVCIGTLTFSALAETEPSIIPLPQRMELHDGSFKLRSDAKIQAGPDALKTAEFLAGTLRKSTGYPLAVVATDSASATKDANTNLGPEGYELSVTADSVVLRASTSTGLFYGAQSLLQLLPTEIFSSQVVANVNWQAPCVQIQDWPRFKWRGFMLDVSRHFYNKSEVEQILDAMALHKLNTFHWHLTDDNGWRIEIKKYPKLTSIGAWRSGVGFGLASNSTAAYGPDGRYGGFYTQKEIREVVAYAADRHITVIPEIEMPGHALAALTAYPEFGTGDGPFEIPMVGGVNPGIFSPAKPETFQFLQDVLTEVFQLFSSPIVHIGGDEVPPEPWTHDAACQALMKKEGLKTPDELESWFIRRIEKFVNAHGKTLIGWSEIARGGLAKNAIVMDWIGGGREAAADGHDVVMTPTSFCYLDYYQSRDHSTEPHAIGGYLPLQKVYEFEPVPAGLDPQLQHHILGGQGNLWTEYIANLKHVEYMAFPRLAALAEVTWSAKEARNFADFTRRLQLENKRLDQLGINYRLYRPETRIKVGSWMPSQIKSTPSAIEWDVTKNVTAEGTARVSLDYTSGACGINIDWVALSEDGKEIARDNHTGFTGASPRDSLYLLKIPAPKPGAHYALRAQVAGFGGTDSVGDVFWDLPPLSSKP